MQSNKSIKLVGCPFRTVKNRLKAVNLRLTKQRVSLGWLMFSRGNRHVTAESFFDEALKVGIFVSLSTIYNTLNQFAEVGLLRQIDIRGGKTYFDTNLEEHHHIYYEDDKSIEDLPAIINLKQAYSQSELFMGCDILQVDVVVKARKKMI